MRVRANRSSPRRTTSPVFQRWATPSDERAGEGAATAHPDEEVAVEELGVGVEHDARPRDDRSSTARCGLRLVTFVVSHEASLTEVKH